MNRNLFIFSILITMFAFSCVENDVYFRYHKIDAEGWHKDSAAVFEFSLADAASCNVYVNIRNTNEYPWQNFWFFVTKSVLTADSIFTQVATDTVECYLANERGKWLGSGAGAMFEMPVLIEQNAEFQPRTYRYEIVQGMRSNLLRGINDVGLRVEKR